ncbi:Afadin [Toxocara canis]|uniref:Afadin n=1 Tax=Toxocara canis TaxID=6265 RepID=A0A0B2V0W0_TOXCA|nr:Afadin [Toxocara canis]
MLTCPTATPAEREQLRRLVEQWNENRLDLFGLSYPSEDLEIHGVMRFYFQESVDKVATKCIRVSSTATTRAVIDALIDKFHPDLKMLSNPDYSLWEVHENGEERCLAPEEKPLLVQLNWHKDDREGRFLLRKHNKASSKLNGDFDEMKRNQKRFSKREKKELKKKHQRAVAQEKEELAAQLYKAVPPTTFTRTISNPEIVMKKRRERKLEAKLKELGHGGSLKVYGYELVPSRPYVTLLVSIRDQASKIVRDTLDKYGLDKENADDYALVQVRLPSSCKMSRSLSDLRTLEDGSCEHYVDPDEYPLLSLGPDVIFLVRPRRRYNTLPSHSVRNVPVSAYANLIPFPQHAVAQPSSQCALRPCLLPITSEGSRIVEGNAVVLQNGVTEVGSAQSVDILLGGELIWPHHAAITFSAGVVTITPSVPNAFIEVNGETIRETVMLRNGDTITIGHVHTFRYFDQAVKTCAMDGVRHETNFIANEAGKLSLIGAPMETTFGVDGSIRALSAVPRSRLHGLRQFREPNLSRSTLDLRRLDATKRNGRPHGSMCDLRDASERVTPAFLNNMLSSLKSQDFESTHSLSASQQRTATPALSSSEEIPALLHVLEAAEDSFLSHILCDYAETLQFKLAPAFIVYMVVRHRIADSDRVGKEQRAQSIRIFLMKTTQRIRASLASCAETLQFKLAPAFIVYMVVRHRIADSDRVGKEQRAQSIRIFLMKTTQRIRASLAERPLSKELYAFWMANSSEMLNFLKRDVELNAITEISVQQLFIECVESSFNALSSSFKDDLRRAIGSLIDCHIDDQSSCNETIKTLNEAVHVLRKHRVNAALTIQLFSQLFYNISAEVFNWLVSPAGAPYCSTAFGVRLSTRLSSVHSWAKQQGMELPAICHMDKIQQAVNLLTTPKTLDDVTALGATCYKLNSVQVRFLLEHVILDVGEEPVNKELIESVVRLAETQADRMAMEDGVGVQLEENFFLQLPFLLPEDGYCSGVLYSVPPSVTSFIGTLQQKGLCCLLPQIKSSTGSWAVHFKEDGKHHMHVSNLHAPLHPVQTHGSMPAISSIQGLPPSDLYDRAPSLSGCCSTQSLNKARYDSVTQPTSHSFPSQQEHVPKIVQISFSRGTAGIGLSIVAAQGIGERSVGIYVKKVVEGSAAHRDGRLEPGDQLLSVNGQSLVGISQGEAAEIMSRSAPVVSFEVSKHAAHYNGLEEWLSNPPSTNSVQPQPIPHMHHHESISSSVPDYANQPYERYQRAGNAVRYVRQNSTSSTSASLYSNPIPYERASNNFVNGSGPVNQSGGMHLPSHYAHSLPDSQLRGNRSVSASELYHGQMDSIGTNSIQSQKQRVMPSHYRAAPRPVVIQPSRPSPSPNTLRRAGAASPSHLLPYTPSTSAQPLTSLPPDGASVRGMNSRSQTPIVHEWRNVARQPSPSNTFPSSSIQHSADYSRTAVTAASNTSKREELNARLDKLEAKGTAMSEAERRTYRTLVDELARAPAQRPLQRPHNLPPPQPIKTQVVESAHEESPGAKQLNELLEDVQQQINQVDVDSPTSNRALATSTPPVRVSNEENLKNKKKGVQWNDAVEGHRDEGDTKLLFNDDEAPEPRVQILGAQEVYRDPRQRRLNEIQARQNASHAQVDGANLGFRDKMKLFAEQLGEKTPKTRYKSSSAQREIEHSIQSS